MTGARSVRMRRGSRRARPTGVRWGPGWRGTAYFSVELDGAANAYASVVAVSR
ncbi:hypothetical protein [Streptomyces sp. KL116D]|uniref:hypothetical protein n=1 Tax=Streptomyces sp. KL116D TaxID=3045152 RepID=UPI003556AB12